MKENRIEEKEDRIEKNEKVIEINSLITEAVKSRDSVKAEVYRSVKVEYVNALHHDSSFVLDDTSSIKILLTMVKQHEDSIEQYTVGKRPDLVEKEKGELVIIKDLIPELPSDDEIGEYTKEVILSYKSEKGDGYTLSMKDMGHIMTKVHSKYPTANGKIISEVLKTFIKK